jgi:hypothetical protein
MKAVRLGSNLIARLFLRAGFFRGSRDRLFAASQGAKLPRMAAIL